MFLSIVIPALNEENYIGILLNSLTKQLHKDFEVLVVDGGSKDSTCDKVIEFSSKINLQLIKSDKKGIAYQRNLGASKAKSDYLIFLDADGFVGDDFLQKLSAYLSSNPNVDTLTSWIEPLSDRKRDKLIFYTYNQFFLDVAKNIKPIAHGAFICIKSSVFQHLKGFRENVAVGEDFDLVIRATKHGYKFAVLKNPKIFTSIRRMETMGWGRYLWAMGKNSLYFQLRDIVDKVPWLDYDLETGGAYYQKKAESLKESALKFLNKIK